MADDDAFRSAIGDVSPLSGKQRAHHGRGAGTPTPAQLERREVALGNRDSSNLVDANYLTLGEVPQRNPRDVLEWKKDGVQREVFARLKAGRYPVDGALDLHGHTVKQARDALFKFIALAIVKRWRTVIVSHGRGDQSATPARIKSYTAAWLIQSAEVSAFHSAPSNRGGTGAVYVMLRKSSAAKNENREQYGGKGEADF